MSRIAVPQDDQIPEPSRPLVDVVRKKLGKVPNLIRILSLSPVALETYLSVSDATSKGELTAMDQERIALVVAQTNGCNYCLAAHSFIAANQLKLADEEIQAARNGDVTDSRSQALVRFARTVVEKQGNLTDTDLASLMAAGFDHGHALEAVTNVVKNILTNYVNHLADTPVDFPAAAPLATAQSGGIKAAA